MVWVIAVIEMIKFQALTVSKVNKMLPPKYGELLTRDWLYQFYCIKNKKCAFAHNFKMEYLLPLVLNLLRLLSVADNR